MSIAFLPLLEIEKGNVMLTRILSPFQTKEILWSAKAVFSHEEAIFFRQLQQALPRHRVFAQAPVASIMQAIPGEKSSEQTMLEFGRQRVDFVVLNRQFEVKFVVLLKRKGDLDERRPLRKALQKARIKVFLWRKNPFPSFEQIVKRLDPSRNTEALLTHLNFDHTLATEFKYPRKPKPQVALEPIVLHEHGNPHAMPLKRLLELAPAGLTEAKYPHIWKRICLLIGAPVSLQAYLASLFIQDRPKERKGLPADVLEEIKRIQDENILFLQSIEELGTLEVPTLPI